MEEMGVIKVRIESMGSIGVAGDFLACRPVRDPLKTMPGLDRVRHAMLEAVGEG